jgi:protein-tyrosine phosphatase
MNANKTKILFICLGNICRSPAAEGVMKKMATERGAASRFRIDSAGIGGWHVGQLPDECMRRHAKQRGYFLDSRARQFDDNDFRVFDYIIVMDDDNYRELLSRASTDEERKKVVRMADYFMKFKGKKSVPDPYYGGDEDFEWALDLIEDGCNGLLALIQ